MIQRRISGFRKTMGVLAAFHFVVAVISTLEILGTTSKRHLECKVISLANRFLYIFANCVMGLYFFHLCRTASTQSNDITIFDSQRKVVKSFIVVPFVFWVGYLLSHKTCPGEPVSLEHTFLHFAHILAETLGIYFYFGWYQAELKRYSGGDPEVNTGMGAGKKSKKEDDPLPLPTGAAEVVKSAKDKDQPKELKTQTAQSEGETAKTDSPVQDSDQPKTQETQPEEAPTEDQA